MRAVGIAVPVLGNCYGYQVLCLAVRAVYLHEYGRRCTRGSYEIDLNEANASNEFVTGKPTRFWPTNGPPMCHDLHEHGRGRPAQTASVGLIAGLSVPTVRKGGRIGCSHPGLAPTIFRSRWPVVRPVRDPDPPAGRDFLREIGSCVVKPPRKQNSPMRPGPGGPWTSIELCLFLILVSQIGSLVHQGR